MARCHAQPARAREPRAAGRSRRTRSAKPIATGRHVDRDGNICTDVHIDAHRHIDACWNIDTCRHVDAQRHVRRDRHVDRHRHVVSHGNVNCRSDVRVRRVVLHGAIGRVGSDHDVRSVVSYRVGVRVTVRVVRAALQIPPWNPARALEHRGQHDQPDPRFSTNNAMLRAWTHRIECTGTRGRSLRRDGDKLHLARGGFRSLKLIRRINAMPRTNPSENASAATLAAVVRGARRSTRTRRSSTPATRREDRRIRDAMRHRCLVSAHVRVREAQCPEQWHCAGREMHRGERDREALEPVANHSHHE